MFQRVAFLGYSKHVTHTIAMDRSRLVTTRHDHPQATAFRSRPGRSPSLRVVASRAHARRQAEGADQSGIPCAGHGRTRRLKSIRSMPAGCGRSRKPTVTTGITDAPYLSASPCHPISIDASRRGLACVVARSLLLVEIGDSSACRRACSVLCFAHVWRGKNNKKKQGLGVSRCSRVHSRP